SRAAPAVRHADPGGVPADRGARPAAAGRAGLRVEASSRRRLLAGVARGVDDRGLLIPDAAIRPRDRGLDGHLVPLGRLAARRRGPALVRGRGEVLVRNNCRRQARVVEGGDVEAGHGRLRVTAHGTDLAVPAYLVGRQVVAREVAPRHDVTLRRSVGGAAELVRAVGAGAGGRGGRHGAGVGERGNGGGGGRAGEAAGETGTHWV